MLQAGARVCKCLGPDFLPYMELVMPQLLSTAAQQPDVSVTHADADEDGEEDEDEDVTVLIFFESRLLGMTRGLSCMSFELLMSC